MFLHSLLVLLVAIQVTLACKCDPLTLLQAMCVPKTVVRARVENVEDVFLGIVPYKRYQLTVGQIFNKQQRQFSTKDGYYYMLFPERLSDCGDILNKGVDYVIAVLVLSGLIGWVRCSADVKLDKLRKGDVDQNGDLLSSRRFYITPYEYIFHDDHSARILRGEVGCNNP